MATTVEGECLGTVADFHRAGHGFSGLRRRYVRRAEFLTRDDEFRSYVRRFREFWNRDHPTYQLRIADPNELASFPGELLTHWHDNERRREQLSRCCDEKMRNDASYEQWRATHRQMTDLFLAPARRAMDDWIVQIEMAAQRYFPVEDFPNPHPHNVHPVLGYNRHFHPAHWFLEIALQTDPWWIEDCDGLFEQMELEPVALAPYGPGPSGHADLAAGEDPDEPMSRERQPETDADLQWCLPLYPGITSEDIRRAASPVADRVNQIYRTRTTAARAVALRAGGCTHREIANRLGLTEPTVRSILKQTDIAAA